MVPGQWVAEEPKCPNTGTGEHVWEYIDSTMIKACCFECECKRMIVFKVPEP